MTEHGRYRLRCVVERAVKDHDQMLLKHFVKIENDLEVSAAYKEAYRIYSKDPDILVLYYESKAKLAKGDFKNDAEREAVLALGTAAKKEIDRAVKLAKGKK